jgi:sec-independent protein translocase protein TatA
MIGGWEVFALVLVILLIFGGRKIPELMRGLGKGVGEFKKGMKENDEDAGKEEKMDK